MLDGVCDSREGGHLMERTVILGVVLLALTVAGCGSRQPEAEEPETPAAPEPAPEPVKARPFGWSGTQPGSVDLNRWFTPESCSECHDEIYNQWQGTMHSNAGRDPLFLAAVGFLRDHVNGEVDRTELRTCTRCHSGAGHLSGGAVDSFSDLSPLTDLYDRGGNFCHFCHSVTGSSPRDGWYEVEPGPSSDDMGNIQGPREDARTEGHAVAYSERHRLASFCGTCHDQNHAHTEVPIQSTFTEWREGPYNTGDAETTVVCQDCHMRQIAGQPTNGASPRPDRPGRSAPSLGTLSPERPHVWVHNFVGANTLVPPLLADDAHGQMAQERLRSAATLEVHSPERAAAGEAVTIEVRVTNTGAGHSIPTGVTAIREMWVELTVRSPSHGVTVLESGVLAEDGSIPEETHTFGTTFGDASGEPVLSSVMASQVLRDHRIGPRETVTESYELTAPRGSGGTLEIRARLLYRPASAAMVRGLLGAQAPEVEITEMATGEATIEVEAGAEPAPAPAAEPTPTPEAEPTATP